jgi:hypothetical protein
MSRKLLPLGVQAEALYWLTKRTATIDEVSQLCGASKTALRNWQRAVIHGECFSDGGIGPDRAAQLQEAYNECLVRHGNQPDELPEPRLYDRRTGQVIETEHDHTASHVTPPAEDPAPETTGLREVLSLRKINAMSGRVEDLDQRVALLETTAAKWLPIIANLCSELGIEVPADEEASAWQTHC